MSVPESDSTESPAPAAHAILRPAPDIAGSTSRIGAYVWCTSRLFEITGKWARKAVDPTTKALFASVASRFAWQASEWHQRLPVLREVEPDELILAPGPRAIERFEDLDELDEISARRDALRDIVADLDLIYQVHGDAIVPLRDGPVGRSIGRVRGDLAELLDDLGLSTAPDGNSASAADLLR